MGLLDVLNGMQQGPRGSSDPGAQSSGGMSPMTMAILGLLAWKAVKHFTRQPGEPSRRIGAIIGQSRRRRNGGGAGGGLGDLLKGGLRRPAGGWRGGKRPQRRAW